ncbi:sensor histidine kinase [Agromyces mangrovi Wang et al. 2018]|uniref:sensor histidine kinase n=1 Tax=Agromyces mangrovi TaxID=1858653 RepID=UPI002573A606|nr:ATP-binding protein [Agromyces mangrovi]BDZ65677.1 two-component system sensor kinase [Agromyces mangrovi]
MGAYAALGAAWTMALLSALLSGAAGAWASVGVLTGLAATLALVVARPSVWTSVLHLVVGGIATYVVAVLVLADFPLPDFASTMMVAVPWIVIILSGTPRPRSAVAAWWAALAYVVGLVSLAAATTVVGLPWSLNVPATVALALVLTVRVYDARNLRSGRREAAGLHRAQRRVREIEIRREFESRATERLHDTALNHLLALGGRGSGPLDPALRSAILHDLELIVGRDWSEEAREPGRSVLQSAVSIAQRHGLDVRVSGTPEAIDRLHPEAMAALRDAITQCLVNVADHSGAHEAEVSVATDGSELTVAVVDDGSGFDPEAVPEDRLGIRASVRGRIERVGGEVQLWSTPGVGTTVLLAVPEATR